MLQLQHRLSRANPINWEIRTLLGTFTTDDRATWFTEPDGWTAELRRSKNGRHWFLAVFEAGVYRRRYDSTGWHAATDRKRIRHLRSYQGYGNDCCSLGPFRRPAA